jgi:hypothetical protein
MFPDQPHHGAAVFPRHVLVDQSNVRTGCAFSKASHHLQRLFTIKNGQQFEGNSVLLQRQFNQINIGLAVLCKEDFKRADGGVSHRSFDAANQQDAATPFEYTIPNAVYPEFNGLPRLNVKLVHPGNLLAAWRKPRVGPL